MEILRAWLTRRVPHVFKSGDNIGGVQRFAPSSLFRADSSHLNAPKGAGNRLGVHSSDKTDIFYYLTSFLLILPGLKPFWQMLLVNVVFGGHIHMITMVTELVSTR